MHSADAVEAVASAATEPGDPAGPGAIRLGPTRYGKAEVRLVHVVKDGAEHSIRDLNVSVALSGDQAETHLTGANARVLTTDAQKNAVYALAKEHGVGSPESFGLLLARHFLGTCPFIDHARVAVDEYAWQRVPGAASRHSFLRSAGETRTALVHADAECDAVGGGAASVVSGLKDLVVLNTTGSEFQGFFKDGYTTLPETADRVLATAIDARWRHGGAAADWDGSHARARAALLTAFADTYSRSLQQTLYAMGERLLREDPLICEVRLVLPNKHHFAVDLTAFGRTNDNEVFYAADRPYGLIEGALERADATAPGRAWD